MRSVILKNNHLSLTWALACALVASLITIGSLVDRVKHNGDVMATVNDVRGMMIALGIVVFFGCGIIHESKASLTIRYPDAPRVHRFLMLAVAVGCPILGIFGAGALGLVQGPTVYLIGFILTSWLLGAVISLWMAGVRLEKSHEQ